MDKGGIMNEYVYFKVKENGIGWVSTIDHKTRSTLVTTTIYKTKNLTIEDPGNNKLLYVLSNVDVLALTNGDMRGIVELV
jgi:hypothetical protein